MNVKNRPALAIAPGRIILRELEARGWSQQDLAEIMDRPEQMISEIIRAKKQVTAETARQLAKAFGTTPDFWLNLEMYYQLTRASIEKEEREIERRSKLYDLAPVKELKRRGWIPRTDNLDDLERDVFRFLGIQNIDQQPTCQLSPRASMERGPEDRNVIAWAKRVEQLSANQSVKPFVKENTGKFIDQLLGCAENEADVSKIPSIMIENGIHFVVVPHFPKTFLDGAALWVDGQPAVGLTLRYDRIDAFWFTLLHELAHIILHHEKSFVDQLYEQGIDSGENDELEANRKASRWLIPEEAFQDFIEFNKPRYSRKAIVSFAEEQYRHPGIVVGQLMYRKEMKYSHLREYLVKVRPMLKEWEDGA